METGSDGRFYDWHFDFNRNGQLEMNELANYQDVTFGQHNYGSGHGGSTRKVILTICFFVIMPILIAVCPFLAIIFLLILIPF